MKNKKIIMFLGIIILLLLILLVGYFIYISNKKNNSEISEYIPEQEIADNQLRNTIVTLYFANKESLNLVPETQTIDSKELINNPYQKLIELLMEQPKNENLEKLIPENTKINKVEKIGDTIYLDFSSDFIKDENLGKEKEMLIINSIVNTLTQLTEINKVNFLIDGNANCSFADNAINFKNSFSKQ